MRQEITSFQQEYLAELEIAEAQLLALAGAVPEILRLEARPRRAAVLSGPKYTSLWGIFCSCRRADTPCQTPRFLSRQR